MKRRPPSLRLAADPAEADRVDRGLSVAEAARAIGVDTSTIRKMVTNGALRGWRGGAGGRKEPRKICVSEMSIEEYKAANAIQTDVETAKASPRARARADDAAHREAVATLGKLGLLSRL